MDLDQALTATVESAINRYLSLDPDALSRFSSLEGRIIAIEFKGLSKTLSLFPSADGFLVFSDFDGEADATISGTPVALAKMAMTDDPKEMLFSGEITITGDTALAGDIAAHKMANLFCNVGQWVKRSSNSVCLDAGEYLQEETHLSPFDEVREAADRLSAKIQIIKNKHL